MTQQTRLKSRKYIERSIQCARMWIKRISNDERGNGFTLLETLVAVTLLSVAMVSPMSLTTQSLTSAYYARDQITASYLAQEGIEAVRSIRDANILSNAMGNSINLLTGIPIGSSFRIDARDNSITQCSADGGTCISLQTDGTLYGYSAGWASTQFRRTVLACFIQSDGSCGINPTDEIKLTVTITWTSGPLQTRIFTASENLYRWINDGSSAG